MRPRILLLFFCGLSLGRWALGASIHYVDCSQGSDDADSLTQHAAWRTLAKANSYTYQPGDSLLLRRGTVCQGMLSPQGSGTEQAPIHLGAYGQGALPEVEGGSEPAALNLHNQQYWEIENLELKGGSPYGIHIGGTEPLLSHFRIVNVVVHDVTGIPLSKDSGLVVIAPDKNTKTRIDDVIVDGVTAYESSEWAGIIVDGAGDQDHGDHIEIRNSIVHDVAGDGILLARTSHGVLEHNVAWNTGMQETQSIGTPNAIWEWRCSHCLVAFNEGFFSDSPGVDGGVFDIDYGDEDNTLTDNFGHDSQGYCVSVFAADGATGNTIRSVIRHNTCIHNGRSPRLAKRQGAIFLYTWSGGKLDGVTIEDNTILWEPPIDAPAFESSAEFTGELPNRVSGNTVLAANGEFQPSASGLDFEGNHYCGKGTASGQFVLQGKLYIDYPLQDPVAPGVPKEFRAASSKPEDLCGCLQNLLADSSGEIQKIGAPKHGDGPADSNHDSLGSSPLDSRLTLRWVLLGSLAGPGEPGSAASRSQLVLMESMMHQFAGLGLGGVVVPAYSANAGKVEQWQTDWNFGSSLHLDAANAAELRKAFNLSAAPELVLISPAGEVAARWQSPVSPADVWLQIQKHLGTPRGTQQMPVCPKPLLH